MFNKIPDFQIKILPLLFLLAGVILPASLIYSIDESDLGESRALSRYFSPILRLELISFHEEQQIFRLGSGNIIRNSEKVFQEERIFTRDLDYRIDYDLGIITFAEEMLAEGSVEIEYSVIPAEINKQFYYYLSQDYTDTLRVTQTPRERFRLDFPDTQLNISGSKTISVSVASDEDFSVYQSLFLRIDGELRRNLRIRAQLSDSQSPLTPEGDTRELSSLDQIFIKLYGNEYEISFGDLDIAYEETQFINFSSRFEGLKAEWFGRNSYQGALAISRGKQSTNEFNGMDGKQGPYFITVAHIGTNVLIIPGSEEVYLNGLGMSRGTDYTIDYSFGSITFTSRHFIDSNSRIFVRFQYSDEDYRQNMYFNSSRIRITDRLTLSHHLIIQNDDRNNPLQETFSETDRQILKEAGDTPAWADGIIATDPGAGLYVKVIEGDLEYYRYVGPEGNGDYVLYFSFVGQGSGDYQQIAPNNFEFVGSNNGSWLPIRLLPSPQYRANYDLSLSWSGEFYEFMGEGIFTKYDRNTFSSLDSFDNDGFGMHWQMRLFPDFTRIDPDWLIYYRYLSQYLNTFSDIRDPQLNYDFYEITEMDSVASSEIGTTLSLNIEEVLYPRVRYLRKKGEDSYLLDNLLLDTTLHQRLVFPRINYRYSFARQSEEVPEKREVNIRQNQVNTAYIVHHLQLGGNYIYRTFRDATYPVDEEEREIGTRYRKKGLTLGTYQTKRAAGQLLINQEYNDLLDDDWQGVREALTFGGEGFLDFSDQRVRGAYSHSEVKQVMTGSESRYDMAEINLNNSLFDRGVNLYSNYALKNLEFYPYVRELIYVGENLGIYDSTGVVTEDGAYDYLMVQVGDPELSIEINADLMLNVTPRFFISSAEDEDERDFRSVMKRFLERIQSESYLQVMENSRSSRKWDVYLLRPELLMNPETTIYGRNIYRQTIWLDVIRGRILAKGAYHRDRVLDNRYQESFRTNITSRELMMRFTRYLSTDFELTYENRVEEESRYESSIRSNSYSLDIRNRLDNNLQFGTLLNITEENGDRTIGGVSYRLRSYGITENVSYFFQRRYRFFARLEYRRNERDGSGFLAFLPEKREGNIFRWNLRLNYQLNQYTSGGVEYSGNNYPLQDTVHQMKVEVRAEF